jgi:hypothetical protein
MVFAIIGYDYKSDLLIIHNTIKGEQYIKNIDDLGFIDALDEKHGLFQLTFEQDVAPCYTARAVVDWLEESVDLITDWPANSPTSIRLSYSGRF